MISMVLISCGISSDDSLSPSSTISQLGDFQLTANVDGTEYVANETSVVKLLPTSPVSVIVGLGLEGDIRLSVPLETSTSTGTFTVLDDDIALSYVVGETLWVANDIAGSGTIFISENTDKYMTGTFFFTGVNQEDQTEKEVTEGSFKSEKLN